MQAPPPVPLLLAELEQFTRTLEPVIAAHALEWKWRPGTGQWSLTEVACHLRDVELEVHQPRFEALIESESAFLPGVAADDWAAERGYQQQDGPDALETFVAARAQTLAMLQGLEPAIWRRRGQHAFFGPTSMHELLNLAVGHDRAHLDQIQKAGRRRSRLASD